jgi:Site-specific recombinases, DNA invertase Pin homologs
MCKSRQAIVSEALAIVPSAAYAFRGSSDAISLCATELYRCYVNDEGEEVTLNLTNGKYAAVYIRVSTAMQKEDGWSAQDQAERGIEYCLSNRLAFRVFSDATLSGKLPHDDQDAINDMLMASKRIYEKAYRNVFFTDKRYSGDQAAMELWLQNHLKRYDSGELDLETNKTKFNYRPALSELMTQVKRGHIHSVVITDLTRLSRSFNLTQYLTRQFENNGVSLIGLIEDLDFVADSFDLGNKLRATFLQLMAEHRLMEICVGTIRGQVQLLAAGKPHAQLPHWLERNEQGDAVLIEERAAVVRRIVKFVINNPELGYQAVCTRLNQQPDLFPPFEKGGNYKSRSFWVYDTLQRMLSSESLIGYQNIFGRRWKVLPPVITEDQWNRLQALKTIKQDRKPDMSSKSDRLLSGLGRCACGATLAYSVMRQNYTYYRCLSDMHGAAKEKGNHVRFSQEKLEDFISEVAKYHPMVLLSPQKNSPERANLLAQIEQLKQDRGAVEADLYKALEAAKVQARENLISSGYEVNDDLQTAVDAMAQLDKSVTAAKGRLKKIGAEIGQIEQVLNTLLPSDLINDTESRMAKWDELPTREKNQLLRRLIARIQFSFDGTDMYLTIVPNTPNLTPLPPIKTRDVLNGRAYIRSLPSVGEWLLTWKAVA